MFLEKTKLGPNCYPRRISSEGSIWPALLWLKWHTLKKYYSYIYIALTMESISISKQKIALPNLRHSNKTMPCRGRGGYCFYTAGGNTELRFYSCTLLTFFGGVEWPKTNLWNISALIEGKVVVVPVVWWKRCRSIHFALCSRNYWVEVCCLAVDGARIASASCFAVFAFTLEAVLPFSTGTPPRCWLGVPFAFSSCRALLSSRLLNSSVSTWQMQFSTFNIS